MSFLKEQIKKLVFKEKYSSESYIKFLRKKGATIGNNCTIYYPRNTNIDYQNSILNNIYLFFLLLCNKLIEVL